MLSIWKLIYVFTGLFNVLCTLNQMFFYCASFRLFSYSFGSILRYLTNWPFSGAPDVRKDYTWMVLFNKLDAADPYYFHLCLSCAAYSSDRARKLGRRFSSLFQHLFIKERRDVLICGYISGLNPLMTSTFRRRGFLPWYGVCLVSTSQTIIPKL